MRAAERSAQIAQFISRPIDGRPTTDLYGINEDTSGATLGLMGITKVS